MKREAGVKGRSRAGGQFSWSIMLGVMLCLLFMAGASEARFGLSWRPGGACPLTTAAKDPRALQSALTSSTVSGWKGNLHAEDDLLKAFFSKVSDRLSLTQKQPECEPDAGIIGQHIAMRLIPFVVTGTLPGFSFPHPSVLALVTVALC